MSAARKSRRRRLLVVAALLVGGLIVCAAVPSRSAFTVSPETTYLTAPLTADGRVAYVSVLNTRLRGDMTSDQNANVLIWQALGPRPEGQPLSDEYFHRSGAAHWSNT